MASYSGEVPGDIPPEVRLDRYASEWLGLLSRSQCKARGLTAQVNGKPAKLSRLLKPRDRLDLAWRDPEPADLIPEDIPLDFIYEDSRTAVINKPQGMVVHPGAGNFSGTLANALAFRKAALGLNLTPSAQEASGAANREALRAGIVHRLDKDTSGVIIVAYDGEAHRILADQFQARSVRKVYRALVQGVPAVRRGVMAGNILRDPRNRKLFTVSETGGKRALTYFRVIKSWGAYSLLALYPKTGRTHQIRVHLKRLGFPILGDPLYGIRDSEFPKATLALHAKSLSIVLPGETESATFKAPLPERFLGIMRLLDKK